MYDYFKRKKLSEESINNHSCLLFIGVLSTICNSWETGESSIARGSRYSIVDISFYFNHMDID